MINLDKRHGETIGYKGAYNQYLGEAYCVVSPERTAGNVGLYSNENLRDLLNLSLLNHQGFKISAISQMSAAEIER